MSEWLALWSAKWQGDAPAYLLTLAVALLVTALVGWPLPRLARWFGAIDVPRGRHQHRAPTARLGGVAVLAGVLPALAAGFALLIARRPEAGEEVWPAIVIGLGAILVCLVGARDDVRSLSPLAKLAGLALAGGVLAWGGVRIDFVELPLLGRIALGPFAGVAVIAWVLACTNAVNLIDGVDGLGAGVAMVAAVVLALVAHGIGAPHGAVGFCAVAGACGGFLLHNREPARLFLGDSGSLLLGFLLAGWSAQGCTKGATAALLLAALAALALPLLDATLAFVRRYRAASMRLGRGQWLAKLRATAVGDRGHIHHRLQHLGHSHRRIARTLSLCTLLLAASASLWVLPLTGRTRLQLLGAGIASALVLWRLAALPSGFSRSDTPVEKDVVLPSATRRRTPRKVVARTHEPV